MIKKEKAIQDALHTMVCCCSKFFCFKIQLGTDEQGLILGLVTTPANTSDTRQLAQILATFEVKKWTRIKADKGYKSVKNNEVLKKLALKNGIMHKKKKGKKIGIWEDTFNKIIAKLDTVLNVLLDL